MSDKDNERPTLADLYALLGEGVAVNWAKRKAVDAIFDTDIEGAIDELFDCEDVRVGELAALLNSIEESAAELAAMVERAANMIDLLPDLPEIREFIPDNDVGAIALLDIMESDATTPLRRLSAVSGACRGEVVRRFGSGDPDKPDAGGRGGIRTKFIGSPRRRFVKVLADLWQHSGKNLASTSDGEFANFVRSVHWNATGDADPPGIEHEIRKVVGLIQTDTNLRSRVWARIHKYEVIAKNQKRFGGEGLNDAKRLDRMVTLLMDWVTSCRFPARRPR